MEPLPYGREVYAKRPSVVHPGASLVVARLPLIQEQSCCGAGAMCPAMGLRALRWLGERRGVAGRRKRSGVEPLECGSRFPKRPPPHPLPVCLPYTARRDSRHA